MFWLTHKLSSTGTQCRRVETLDIVIGCSSIDRHRWPIRPLGNLTCCHAPDIPASIPLPRKKAREKKIKKFERWLF